MDIWPALPILILGHVSEELVDDAVAGLEHVNSDRISQINLNFSSQIENLRIAKLWTAMQGPFPELVALYLSFECLSHEPVVPDSFLGGSAPRLRFLKLNRMPFPGLPKLLLSATHLVELHLYDTPHSGYILPEAMATCLSTLTSLKSLRLEFESPQSYPDQENRRSHSRTRSVLPSLRDFWFKGVNEYLEDLLSRIEAPRVCRSSTTFLDNIHWHFDTPELNQFISRMSTFGGYNEAHLIFRNWEALVRLQSHPKTSGDTMVEVKMLCRVSGQQFSSLAQICTSLLHLFLTMESLYIYENQYLPPYWVNDNKNTKWLDVLLPFTAVKNLYLSKQFSPRITPALQKLTGGRTIEVLPALQNVLLEGFQPSKPVQKGIARFISARQLANHPVAISAWHRGFARGQL
jgi:hypothetical protein